MRNRYSASGQTLPQLHFAALAAWREVVFQQAAIARLLVDRAALADGRSRSGSLRTR